MNSGSSRWGSDCLSIAHFQPFGEFSAACFAHTLLKFGCFQPNVQADNNALRGGKEGTGLGEFIGLRG